MLVLVALAQVKVSEKALEQVLVHGDQDQYRARLDDVVMELGWDKGMVLGMVLDHGDHHPNDVQV